MELREIKQELNNAKENEDFDRSVTSNHSTSQTAIKREENSRSQAEEDSVHPNKMISPTCQVKTEPQSEDEEDGWKLESKVGDYPGGFVIKREIIEVDGDDHHMMDNEVDHSNKTTEDDDSGTYTNRFVKSENENLPLNSIDEDTDEQESMSDITREMNKQQIPKTIGNKNEISRIQIKTLCCQTKKSHECSVCAKPFQNRQACLQHMWDTHTGEKPYSCEVCGKGFKYISYLKRHKIVHSDERPLSCDLCKNTFKQKHVLQAHKASCHSNERPYSCDLCKKTFKQKVNVDSHKTTAHSDERPYFCNVCNKAFKRKDLLQKHEVCHTNERPYSCDVCNKAFKQKYSLQRHKLISHSLLS